MLTPDLPGAPAAGLSTPDMALYLRVAGFGEEEAAETEAVEVVAAQSE